MSTLDDKLKKYVQKPQKGTKPGTLILYGRPGSGKSHLAATASELPGVKKVLYIDVEGSTEGVLEPFDTDKIDVIRVDQMPLDDQFDFANAILEGLAGSGTDTYQVVVIDTFDVLQDLCEKKALADGKTGFDIWREVGNWSTRAANILRSSSALGIMVVHSKETRSETGANYSGLNLKGAAKESLPGIPPAVLYLERGPDGDGGYVTTVYTQPHKSRDTKNRFGWPDAATGVTLPKLWKLIDDNAKDKK